MTEELDGIRNGDPIWQSTLLNDVLAAASQTPLSLELYRDSEGFRIVSQPPRFLLLACELLESPDLRGVTFDKEAGILTVEDNHGTSVQYRPVMTTNFYTAVLLEKV